MIPNCSAVVQALLGTLFTWGLTAAGSALVFVFSSGQRRILDGSLGFAAGNVLGSMFLAGGIMGQKVAGVLALIQNRLACPSKPCLCIIAIIRCAMQRPLSLAFPVLIKSWYMDESQSFPPPATAMGWLIVDTLTLLWFSLATASYWSLLAPAIELAEESGDFGAFAFFPVAVGFTLGAAFVYFADLLLPLLGISDPPHAALSLSYDPRAVKEKYDPEPTYHQEYGSELSIRIGRTGLHSDRGENGEPYQRKKGVGASHSEVPAASQTSGDSSSTPGSSSWRRILLLILAVTIHNIPEGLAVGVGFGAIGKSASATFESARNLAIGIGIQNFPEGLAVSLPLRGAGFSTWRAFWYGQLSGMVEPLAGVFGAFAMVLAEPLLPYALGFAAGAMVYVVMDDIIPEAQTSGNGKLASWTSIVGFVVMMSLDVGLG